MMTIRIWALLFFAAAASFGGENPAFDDPKSIFFQSRKGKLEEVQAILNSRPSMLNAVDDLGRTPLFYAAKSGHAEVVDWLLGQEGIQTGLLDSYGYSALHWPAMYGHLQVLNTMSEHKLDLDIRSESGETPLHAASGNIFSNAHGRHAEVVKLLLKRGASPALADKKGRTPLFSAFTLVGKLEAAEALLADPRTEINTRDQAGDTVLHHAVRKGSVEAVKLLLEKGADPSIRNREGKLPADGLLGGKLEKPATARDSAHSEIQGLLDKAVSKSRKE